jgi:hypothetical protein
MGRTHINYITNICTVVHNQQPRNRRRKKTANTLKFDHRIILPTTATPPIYFILTPLSIHTTSQENPPKKKTIVVLS